MRQDEATPILGNLTVDDEFSGSLVDVELGVARATRSIHTEEPHHAAARLRTDEEQAALVDRLTGDELRALRRVRSDRDIVTVNPGAAL